MGQNFPSTNATASQVSALQTSVNALPTSASLSSQAGVAIKSIQRGFTLIGANPIIVTISAVNTSKCNLCTLGSNSAHCALVLTNSTTITLYGAGTGYQVAWEITEYY